MTIGLLVGILFEVLIIPVFKGNLAFSIDPFILFLFFSVLITEIKVKYESGPKPITFLWYVEFSMIKQMHRFRFVDV